ncbi:MAG: serine--tRNA ligase [Thermoplasmata archaeon]|nr:MAG: serine--tRNA ligase [Thermoplasmata archaeon]
MKFDLQCSIQLSKKADELKEELEAFIKGEELFSSLESYELKADRLHLRIVSDVKRSHEIALRFYKKFAQFFGKKKIGVRGIHIDRYHISFEAERQPKKAVSIPFAEVTVDGTLIAMTITDKGEEFLRQNYVDRMIRRIREKIDMQHYEGKKEYWRAIWQSEEKEPVWNKDPSEEMQRAGWITLLGKGKWFYFPPAAALMRAMERIAFQEVVMPLGFKEVIEPMHVSFDTWIKTGHLEGMPGEIYYISEPKNREAEEWERFVDLLKIQREVDETELLKNLKPPKAGVCYAQCPNIYTALAGKTIAKASLPLLLVDRSTPSDRYEAGGKHGIERVDEFHRIEIVYIGTRDQLLQLKEKLVERYRHVFENILDLEWRMATVTPFYLQQAGIAGMEEDAVKGTIDFEAWLPYRGDRSREWLEIQNISIVGDKYTRAFTIKTQRGDLWSGCSGIGLERWMVAFLAQKGMDPEHWPDEFRKYVEPFPDMPEFL